MKEIMIKQHSDLSIYNGDIKFEFKQELSPKEAVEMLNNELSNWGESALKRIQTITIK